MTKKFTMAMAVLFVAASLNAAEHPSGAPASGQQGQPTGASAMGQSQDMDQMEHPAGNPSAQVSESSKLCPLPNGPKARLNQIRKEYVNAVRDYVKSKKPFVMYDDKLNKDWVLKLVRVHKDKIVQLGKNEFFACSDFKSVKKGEKGALDLDFFASRKPDGTWKVEKVLIHKVNGKPRYTWNKKNEMVPAKD